VRSDSGLIGQYGWVDVIESVPAHPRWLLKNAALLAAATATGLLLWVLGRPPEAAPLPSTSASPTGSQTGYGFLPLFPTGPLPPAALAVAVVAPVKPPRFFLPATTPAALAIAGISSMPQGKYTAAELADGFLVTSRPAYAGTGLEPPTDAYLVRGDLSVARHLATAGTIALGADGRSVLAVNGPSVTRVGLDGTRREEATLPPGRGLAVDTIAGYIIGNGTVGPWEIWDPRTGEVRHRFQQLFAASGGTVAYGSHSRAITLLDLASGTRLETEIPDRELAVHQAALSRDGRYLAAHLINRGQWQHLIAVFDSKASLWYAMPGTPFAALNQMALAWSGGVLVLAYTVDQPAVALWRPGDATVYGVPLT
jgi:hypothetical protein